MMKAVTLVANGHPDKAFEIREHPIPDVGEGLVRIKVEAFGINFADVMARNGLYREAPPTPCIIGYEVVGRVDKIGPNATCPPVGTRVVAFTRFGAYAEYAVTGWQAVAEVPEDMPAGKAVALATQYCTAWHSACEQTNIFPGDNVLIHAAAGGVGTALVQIAKLRGATVFGTAGSAEKLDYLRENGVDHPINYRSSDFVAEVKKVLGKERLDVVFDSIGGKNYSQSRKLLGAAGRIVNYGAAQRSGQKGGIFATIKLLFDFGFLHPIGLIVKSQAAIGVNMLRVADYKPHAIQRCLTSVVALTAEGKLNPKVGGVYKVDQIGEAHLFIESRKSVGKIVVEW